MINQTDEAVQRLLQRIEELEVREGTPDSGWIGLPYTTGWENFVSNHRLGQYRKIGDRVFIRGLVKRTSGSSDIIATLPVGFRPSLRELYTINRQDAAGFCEINASGELLLRGSGGYLYMSLAQVIFWTD